MEYKELSSITANLETYLPFGVDRIEESNVFCAVSRSKAQILELNYQHHHDGNIRFIQTSVPYPKHIPSQDIAKDWNSIYNRAEGRHRNEMQLDPMLVPEILNQTELTFAMITARFAPRLLNRNGYHLACLSNYGGCEVQFKRIGGRSWTIVCNLSGFWSGHCRRKYERTLHDFAALRKYVSDTHLTALCWNNSITEDELQICVVNALGTVAFIQLMVNNDADEHQSVANILLEKDTNLKKVNMLEWITFHDKQMKKHSFVVVGDLVGDVTIFPVEFSAAKGAANVLVDLKKGINLWKESDSIRADGIKWKYHVKAEQLVLIYCKGSHVFAHVLSKTGKPLSHCKHHIDGLFITSIHPLTSTEYIIGTLNARLEQLSVDICNNRQISISATEVRHEIDTSKFLLYGLTGSTNNAFLVSALHIGQPYDHLRYRQTATILVQQVKNENVLEKLQQNKINKLTFKHDYVELFRCQQCEDDAFADYYETIPAPIEFDDAYLYKLKVRLIATSARSTYFRRRCQLALADMYFSEFEIVKKLLFAIRCCRGIKYLSSLRTELSEFQAQSLRCQRNYVRDFLSTELTESYEKLRIEIQADIEVLLTESEEASANVVEKCVYCDGVIDDGKLMCGDNHELPRCCLSMTQVSILNKKSCMQCFTITHDDQDILMQLFPNNDANELICPMCDSPFHGYPFTAEEHCG